ncbi:acetyl-CoA hydrolase/transferase C-terminal domain-containing protein, partial [Roseovarius sp. D22-M7]|uniref:acetyl-CoA hydrolase/transferase C-terminal domain-containing protein n=1 Tax=Roseovarius sp. D22-M7 TaxID=3127116 RepID=UPI00300FE195
MNGRAPTVRFDAARIAADIIQQTNRDIRLALPLGLGKANTIVNALMEHALEDRAIHLSIFTALTLERPNPRDPIGSRFIGPARDRLFGRYPALQYAELLRRDSLPKNIAVQEFFFLPGKWLRHPTAQQNHISAKYTHVLGYLLAREPNVVAQLLARDADGRLSLSCNTDISSDLLALRRQGKTAFLFAGEINSELPFMPGSAVIEPMEPDLLLDDPKTDFELFSAPRQPLSLADHAIGLHVSRLVPDGGTLQIGIGAMGDAVAHALRLRHQEPAAHRDLVLECPFPAPAPEDHQGSFEAGLYCVTKMLGEGLLALFEAGVIRQVRDGAAIHAGFFIESRDFYRRLRSMAMTTRRAIDMRPISYTNALYGDEQKKRAVRAGARFINGSMKVTALGAAISDALEDGQVVDGVGGQFDFVSQAFALEGARSILPLPATRRTRGKLVSNIPWSYPTETIPRHLRDIVVPEYGIADLRGRSDAETIQEMIRISDSRFQDGLAEEARSAGKLRQKWKVPDRWKVNTPERVRDWLGDRQDQLGSFPFGNDITQEEQDLLSPREQLRTHQGDLIWSDPAWDWWTPMIGFRANGRSVRWRRRSAGI